MYGERLHQLRKEKRLTMDEIADELDMKKSTYAGYENKYRRPPLHVLKKFSEYFNVSVDYIIGVSHDRDPKKVASNLDEYIKKEDLTWNGVPVTRQELDTVKHVLNQMIQNRTKYYDENKEKQAIS